MVPTGRTHTGAALETEFSLGLRGTGSARAPEDALPLLMSFDAWDLFGKINFACAVAPGSSPGYLSCFAETEVGPSAPGGTTRTTSAEETAGESDVAITVVLRSNRECL